MIRNILKLIVFSLVLVFPFSIWASNNLIGDELPFNIETNVTWSTLLQPEINLLIRNKSSNDIKIDIYFGNGRVECHGELNNVDSHYSSRIARVEKFYKVDTIALVPGGGWTHRSYPIGKDGLIAPCRIPFSIKSMNAKFRPIIGMIDVPDLRGMEQGGDISASSLSVESMVEKDELAQSRFILRLLVYNNEENNLRVRITDRMLECKNGIKAKWGLHNAPLQGESVGPIFIKSHGWGVFVSAIDLNAENTPDLCEGKIILSADNKQGYAIPVKEVNFSLTPVGIYSMPDPHGQ